jgi:hypothetical protein
LPIQPEFTGAINIRILSSLDSATEQQNYLGSCDGVIDSVSCSLVNAQLPYPITTKLVIAEVAQLYPVDSSVNDNLRLGIAELETPFHEEVFVVLRKIVANLVH